MLRATLSARCFVWQQRLSAHEHVRRRRQGAKGLLPGKKPKGARFEHLQRRPFREKFFQKGLSGAPNPRTEFIFDRRAFYRDAMQAQRRSLLQGSKAVRTVRAEAKEGRIQQRVLAAREPWRQLQ